MTASGGAIAIFGISRAGLYPLTEGHTLPTEPNAWLTRDPTASGADKLDFSESEITADGKSRAS